MPEIRFTVTKKLNGLVLGISDDLGVDKSDYVKSLVLGDLRKKGRPKNEDGKNEDRQL
ncbi:hypothetical protein HYU50_00580 [Candidatus Woesearchaeota archaeon]|nr:hypothetical protein [Candidatus Woesearchaeota archaeon]